MIFSLPVSFLILAAFWVSKTGAYVSGRRITHGKVLPAKIAPKPKTHLHVVFCAMNPDTGGAITGPIVVTTMKTAIDWPRFLGSELISAKSPDTHAIGADPKSPQQNRKSKRLAQLGATAQAIVKILNKKNDISITGFRP